MELFSEIYSCYYNVVEKILNLSLKNPLSKSDMTEIISSKAFSESAFYILPKLITGEWNLMKNTGSQYESKLGGEIKLPVTLLQKAWLKSLLSDMRIALFLNNEEIAFLENHLKDTAPLFDVKDFYYFDAFLDGDDYGNEDYVTNFHSVLKALKSKTIITISFESGKGQRITGNYLPQRIEYSSKDDKFRVYAVRIRYGKIVTTAIINMSRIASITDSKESFSGDLDFDNYTEYCKVKEPIVIEISKERNAVERCMLHFASFEKRTEYDETTDRYISYIYYDKQDETELLIRILSFGPVIRVLGPVSFLEQVKERVRKQAELLIHEPDTFNT